MGIPISIDIPKSRSELVFRLVFERLRAVDRQFSTYKPDSELSRYRRGEIIESGLSADMVVSKEYCAKFEDLTDGYFSAYYNGTFDPTGFVKGWAIQQAAGILAENNEGTYLINAAGDILASSVNDKVWSIGLQDPTDKQSTIGTINMRNGAVATSGTYERGAHINDPHTKKPVYELLSSTVWGPDIITCDVFATTCQAMGHRKALDFMELQQGYEAILVDNKGLAYMTSGFVSPKMQIAQQ